MASTTDPMNLKPHRAEQVPNPAPQPALEASRPIAGHPNPGLRSARPLPWRWLPGPFRGTLAFSGYVANTLFWGIPLLGFSLLKFIVPFQRWRQWCDRVLNSMAGAWIAVNNLNLRSMNRIHWDVQGVEGIDPDGWHLVLANHQSWVDILVLQKIFHRRIPFLKFFLKQELIWVPVLGLAWWALDFPFVKRYSKATLQKRPHLRGKDIEITRKACAKFKRIPVSIMNFVEGTRFNREKHRKQNSPYTHLLRPKSGGVALVLTAMGEQISSILDVTIVYPGGARSFWDMLCGRLEEVRVRVDTVPAASILAGDNGGHPTRRIRYQDWINDLWSEKDRRISSMLQ